jgi:hypothetical protein
MNKCPKWLIAGIYQPNEITFYGENMTPKQLMYMDEISFDG